MASYEQNKYGGYASAIATLSRHQVKFVVCGGIACVFHGVPRATLDLDVLVELTDENLERLIAASHELGLQPRISEPIEALKDRRRRRDWVENKNAKVFTLQASDSPLQIDVFLDYPVSFEEAFRDARIATIDGLQFRISSIEHLIRAKQAVQPLRSTDQFDLHHLHRILEHGTSQ